MTKYVIGILVASCLSIFVYVAVSVSSLSKMQDWLQEQQDSEWNGYKSTKDSFSTLLQAVDSEKTTEKVVSDSDLYAGENEISNEMVAAAVQWAVDRVGLGYSQGAPHNATICPYCQSNSENVNASRMGPTHYDCSSFVFTAYKDAGYQWGCGSTSGVEGEWLESSGCGVEFEDMQPGDLIFYNSNRSDRYKGIGHVSMYIGNNQIVHAKGTAYGVVLDVSTYNQSNIVVIARPTMIASSEE